MSEPLRLATYTQCSWLIGIGFAVRFPVMYRHIYWQQQFCFYLKTEELREAAAM